MKRYALVTAMVIVFAAAVSAQVVPQDAMELQLAGNVDFQGPSGKAVYDVELGFGYFVLDDIEVGPLLALISDGDEKGFGLGLFGEYNIDVDMSLVPYVGLSAMYINGKVFNENAVQIEGAIGLKFFLAENVAVSGAFVYDYATGDCYYNDGKWQDTDYGLKFGVRAYF